MKVQIEIDVDNDAFQPLPGAEVARLLRNYADQIDGSSLLTTNFVDLNGHTVGHAKVLGDWES